MLATELTARHIGTGSALEERLRKIEAIFKQLDVNGSKVITRTEFVGAMTTSSGESLWGVFSPEAAMDLFKEIDVSRTGKITKAKARPRS